MPLTDTMLQNLKADDTSSKLADSEGLYLYLSPTGSKLCLAYALRFYS